MNKVILYSTIFIFSLLTSCARPAGTQFAGTQGGGMIALLLPLLVFLVPWLVAVLKLKNNDIDNISKVLWAIFITWTPIVGPICYFVIDPKKEIA